MLGRDLAQLVVALVVAVLAATSAVAGEDRVALVIGNAAYTETAPLANPANDANDVAAALEGLGFEVIKVVDGDKLKMERAVRSFGDLLAGADVSLFFYAGHGLQVSGRNYLVPTNARLVKEQDLLFEAIEVGLPLRVMEQSGARVKIVILDACRNNPLAGSLARSVRAAGRSVDVGRGLARLDGAAGTLIAFATAPDDVAADGKGRNSPFTRALLEWIDTPGLEIRAMLGRVRGSVWAETNEKQLPWVNEALLGEFYFAGSAVPEPSAGTSTQTAAIPPPTALTEPEIEPIEAEYVAVNNANVRERPTVRSRKVTTLKRGTEVHVAGKVKGKNWYLVERDDEPLGYVYGALLMPRQQAKVPERLPPTAPAPSAPSQPLHSFDGRWTGYGVDRSKERYAEMPGYYRLGLEVCNLKGNPKFDLLVKNGEVRGLVNGRRRVSGSVSKAGRLFAYVYGCVEPPPARGFIIVVDSCTLSGSLEQGTWEVGSMPIVEEVPCYGTFRLRKTESERPVQQRQAPGSAGASGTEPLERQAHTKPTARAEEVSRPDRRQKPDLTRAVQRALAALGYHPGAIDSVGGRQTREAIRKYQFRHGLPVDGEVSEKLLVDLWNEGAKQ